MLFAVGFRGICRGVAFRRARDPLGVVAAGAAELARRSVRLRRVVSGRAGMVVCRAAPARRRRILRYRAPVRTAARAAPCAFTARTPRRFCGAFRPQHGSGGSAAKPAGNGAALVATPYNDGPTHPGDADFLCSE